MLLGPDGSVRPTIFAEMSALAVATGAINLGQGFPDEDGPPEVLEAARQAIADGINQYPPGRGIPQLREAIAAHQQHWYGFTADPDREVVVTAGATEALTAAILALTEPGDELVTFEPFYDSYAAVAALAGVKLVTVPLRWPDFEPDLDELAAAVTDRTRVILVNSPHNPTGAVFGREVLTRIVELAERSGAIIVTDEVYEHLTFGAEHIPIATLPGARERTVTISSGGKTFSTTGWKIGWFVAPPELADAVLAVKQYLTYVNGAPFQPAIAVGLGLPDEVILDFAAALGRKRDLLVAGLRAAGLDPAVPDGTYFVVADAGSDGAQLCRELPAGSASPPCRSPHSCRPERQDQYRNLVRFAFCKRTEVLEEAVRRLSAPDGEPPQLQRGVDAAHLGDARGEMWATTASTLSPIERDLDAHRVHDHAVARTDRWRVVGRRDVDRVLQCTSGDEGAPVVLLERPAHPLRGNEHEVGAGVDQAAGHLGEADVVAGLQPHGEPRPAEGLRRLDVARLHPVRLLVAERVVQVQLAVGREHLARGTQGRRSCCARAHRTRRRPPAGRTPGGCRTRPQSPPRVARSRRRAARPPHASPPRTRPRTTTSTPGTRPASRPAPPRSPPAAASPPDSRASPAPARTALRRSPPPPLACHDPTRGESRLRSTIGTRVIERRPEITSLINGRGLDRERQPSASRSCPRSAPSVSP